MIKFIDNRVYFPENFKVILKKILWLLSNIIYKKIFAIMPTLKNCSKEEFNIKFTDKIYFPK